LNYIRLVLTIFLFSTLIGNIVPTYAETLCPNGLVSYWPLDETSGTTAMDSKDGNHGTVNNGEGWTTGKINNGFEFFGSQISIVAWFKADDFGVNDGRIVSKATSQEIQDHIFMLSTRGCNGGNPPYRMRFRLKLDGNTRTLIDGGCVGSDTDNVGGTNIDLVADVWYFAVATYDGSDMRIYLNGQEIARTDRTGGISTSSANVWIGDNPGPDRKQFDGIIDEVAIYNRALSDTEILSLYNGDAGVEICTGGTCPAGLISYWRLDETSGTTATDSKNGNHGTVYSGASWVPGKINNGLRFVGSGSNNYVDLGQFNIVSNYIDLGNFDVASSGLTIAAWIKADSFTVNDGRIISKATSQATADHYWMLSTRGVGSGGSSPYRMRFRVKTSGTTTTLVDGNPTGGGGGTDAIPGTFVNLATDTWYFVVATYDGTNMRIYVDGTEVARRSKSGTIDANPAVSVWMGDNPGPNRKQFDGIIDEVSIFNRALTSTEINNLATTGKAICYIGDATNQYGIIQDIFHPRSAVYATGNGFVPNSLVDLYITTDQAWTDGMAITDPIRMTTVQADASGNIGPVMAWASADFGNYDLIFDTNQNGQYDVGADLIGFDVVDHPNHPGFSVSSLLTSTIVGGFYVPVNSLSILAPYVIAALFIGIVASIIAIRRKTRD
jgi:hypothetical protein